MTFAQKLPGILLVGAVTWSLASCGGGTAQNNSSTMQGVDLRQAIASNTYINSTGQRMFTFDASGNGVAYANIADANFDSKYKTTAITWNIDGSNLTIATGSNQEILHVSPDGGTLTGATGSPASYTKAKPLSVASLNGKHLSENIAAGSECAARTLSFSGNTLTVREACGNTFNQIDLAVEEVSGIQGIIQATGSFNGYGLSYHIALQDGDVNKQSTLAIRAEKEGEFSIASSNMSTSSNMLLNSVLKGVDTSPSMRTSKFTSAPSPLVETIGLGVTPGFTATNKAGCGLFNQHYYTCPEDNDLAKILPESCVHTAPIWMVKSGGIACLLKGDNPLEAYLFGHDGKSKIGVSLDVDRDPKLTP